MERERERREREKKREKVCVCVCVWRGGGPTLEKDMSVCKDGSVSLVVQMIAVWL